MAAVDLRYARALAAVIADQKLDAIAAQGQLNDFVTTLEASAELREVLGDPSIPEPQKLKVLDAIAAKAGMSGAVRNFIALIAHHQRLHELREMVAAYARIEDEETRVAEAQIVSAHPLDEGNRKLLEEQISKLTGGLQVRASYSEDATLLGGAVVKVGSTVYDGSIRAQLQQLKQRLIAAGAN
jgi:F-type H+-transporting ATPase subunit delta